MAAFKGLLRRLRALVFRTTTERELDEEIRLHIELETSKNLRLGLSEAEARRKAKLDFGGVEVAKETHRDVRGARVLEDLAADVRYALRSLRRNKLLAGASVLTLALGIGANTAIFSAVNAVILRPLPFAHPERLMMLHEENAEKGWHLNVVAPANYVDWKEQTEAFEGTAAYNSYRGSLTLTGNGAPRLLGSARVTGNFFDVLGVRAALGRTFTDAETFDVPAPIVVISHTLWEQLGGGDQVGRSITLNGVTARIVGVLPAGYHFPFDDVDVYATMGWTTAQRSQVFFRRAHNLRAIARLRPGVSREAASAQFQTVVRRLQVDYPVTNRVMGADMTPLHEFLVGDTRAPLLVLLGAVALLMVIACANVGNLALVQAAGREREAALRLTLGAGRGRLVRQALTESLVLAAVGGFAGLGLGWAGTRVLTRMQPQGLLPVQHISVDWWVLLYIAAIALASGLLFGIAPAMWSGRRAPSEILKEGGRGGSASVRMRRWGNVLVVAEVSLALTLTLGAALLVRSFLRLQDVDPGFDPARMAAVTISLPGVRYDSASRINGFFDQLAERARALPGVEGVTMATVPPLNGVEWTSDYMARGRAANEYGTEVAHREVAPDYFTVMKVPLMRGRLFTADDRIGTNPVVIINQALADRYFHGQDPVGQLICFDRAPDSNSTWRTIVGVVGSERQTSLATASQIEIYTSLGQQPTTFRSLLVRSRQDPMDQVPAIRNVVRELDPELAIVNVTTMDQTVARSIASQRFLMTLLFAFAATGLTLAIVGVYGVMAQMARGRSREMGIRMALGARAGEVQWMVVRYGMRLAGTGVLVGLVAAVAGGRLIRNLLFDVSPMDPATFVGVPVLLALTAIAASWLPALRASRTSPAIALQDD